jgi:integrase
MRGSAVANSTAAKPRTKPEKTSKDFPLYKHPSGRWYKKVKGKFCYFGKVANDPKGEKALLLWLDQKDDLLAGRKPRGPRGGLTVEDLCVHFLTAKENSRDAGELSADSFSDYLLTCKLLSTAFGRNRLVDDLSPDDFQSLRASLAKKYGVCRLGNTIVRVRSVFKHGLESKLIATPIAFGPSFEKPSKKTMRQHRQKNGKRMFEADQIRTLLNAAGQPMKAMILLGINCGFGNNDCATLPLSKIDLKDGWIDYPRPKTAVERRCPLWPETVSAIKDAIACRPATADGRYDEFAFVTRWGNSWAKEIGFIKNADDDSKVKVTGDNGPITKEFKKLVDKADEKEIKDARESGRKPAPRIYRSGIGFYALRHTFATIGLQARDRDAVQFIMGHEDGAQINSYDETGASDERLRAVVDHIREWLFPQSVNASC